MGRDGPFQPEHDARIPPSGARWLDLPVRRGRGGRTTSHQGASGRWIVTLSGSNRDIVPPYPSLARWDVVPIRDAFGHFLLTIDRPPGRFCSEEDRDAAIVWLRLRQARPGHRPVQPSPPAIARPGLRPARLGLRPARLGLRPARLGLRPARLGLRPARLGLRPARLGLGPARPGLRPARPPANGPRIPLPTAQTRGRDFRTVRWS